MKKILILLFSLPLFCQYACHGPAEKEPLRKLSSPHFSQDYAPPFFEETQRIRKFGAALSSSHRFYREAAEAFHLPGLVYGVVVDDSLIFFGACGSINLEKGIAATEHSLFRIASMSKSFTAMAILKLRDEGKLSLSDPISAYIPELDQLHYLTGDTPPVTIFNLLTMTAGFPEDNPWGDRFLDISDEALIAQVEKGISFSTVSSLHYEYSNLGFGLLGHIISVVSGEAYQVYIDRNILQPLEMRNTCWEYSEVPMELLAQGYRWEDEQWIAEPMLHDGAFGAMGGLITSIEDFSKYMAFHLSAWPPRSDPDTGPVKRSTLREMHMMNNPGFYTDPNRFGDQSAPFMRGYGFGLVSLLDREGIIEIGHNGGLPGFGSSYMFYPQYGVGIMAFSNLTYVGGSVRTANYMVMKELINKGVFIPRVLPVSEILERRKEQVFKLLLSWDTELEKEIVAANLYLDVPRETRMKEASRLLQELGEIVETGPLIPENQLRGSFLLKGEKQCLEVFFTLTPEAEPKVQWLSLEVVPGK